MRVLLADADAVSRKVAQLMLERLGHRVDIVPNGLEATLAVQRVHYDVVMLENRMPEMDGRHAVEVIRAGHPVGGQPVIVAVSGDDPTREVDGDPAPGVDLVLAKPFRLGQLAAMLERVVARASGPLTRTVAEVVDGQAAILARLADMAGPDPAEDREVFSDILRSLARRAPVDIQLIDEAARRSAHGEVEDRAHSLRGAVVTLGGAGLGCHLEEVESCARAQRAVPRALFALVRAEQARFGTDLLAVAGSLDRT
jgi:CheY-like chemotaxis protein